MIIKINLLFRSYKAFTVLGRILILTTLGMNNKYNMCVCTHVHMCYWSLLCMSTRSNWYVLPMPGGMSQFINSWFDHCPLLLNLEDRHPMCTHCISNKLLFILPSEKYLISKKPFKILLFHLWWQCLLCFSNYCRKMGTVIWSHLCNINPLGGSSSWNR